LGERIQLRSSVKRRVLGAVFRWTNGWTRPPPLTAASAFNEARVESSSPSVVSIPLPITESAVVCASERGYLFHPLEGDDTLAVVATSKLVVDPAMCAAVKITADGSDVLIEVDGSGIKCRGKAVRIVDVANDYVIGAQEVRDYREAALNTRVGM
jgi:hypothetical protein